MSLFGPPNIEKLKAERNIKGLIKALSYHQADPQKNYARETDLAYKVRKEAAIALGELGNPLAVEPLIRLLEHEPKDVQFAAVDALGQIGDPRAVEPLIIILHKSSYEDYHVRRSAARVLVSLYKSNKLSLGDKQAILAERESIISKHYDSDERWDAGPGRYTIHHNDTGGLGVLFPL